MLHVCLLIPISKISHFHPEQGILLWKWAQNILTYCEQVYIHVWALPCFVFKHHPRLPLKNCSFHNEHPAETLARVLVLRWCQQKNPPALDILFLCPYFGEKVFCLYLFLKGNFISLNHIMQFPHCGMNKGSSYLKKYPYLKRFKQ